MDDADSRRLPAGLLTGGRRRRRPERGRTTPSTWAASPSSKTHPEAGGRTGTAAADPHFWLDPLRLAAVGRRARRLGSASSTRRRRHASPPTPPTLRADLEALDRELARRPRRRAPTGCSSRVTPPSATSPSGTASQQHAITDLSPEAEPTPESLAAIADFVRANGVTTIYSETLVSPAVAETVAGESGRRGRGPRPDRGPGRRRRAAARLLLDHAGQPGHAARGQGSP